MKNFIFCVVDLPLIFLEPWKTKRSSYKDYILTTIVTTTKTTKSWDKKKYSKTGFDVNISYYSKYLRGPAWHIYSVCLVANGSLANFGSNIKWVWAN